MKAAGPEPPGMPGLHWGARSGFFTTGTRLGSTADSPHTFGLAFALAFALAFLTSHGTGLRDGAGWLFQLVFTLRPSVISKTSLW